MNRLTLFCILLVSQTILAVGCELEPPSIQRVDQENQIVISAIWPGATSTEVEQVVVKIEEAVESIGRVNSIRTEINFDHFELLLSCEPTERMDRVIEEVRTELDNIRSLPDRMEDISVALKSQLKVKSYDIKIELDFPGSTTGEKKKKVIESIKQPISEICPDAEISIDSSSYSHSLLINKMESPQKKEPKIRETLDETPGVLAIVDNRHSTAQHRILILTSDNRDALIDHVNKVKERLRAIEGTRDLRVKGIRESPQIEFDPDDSKMANHGISMQMLTETLRQHSAPKQRFEKLVNGRPKALSSIKLKSKDGAMVPIQELCQINFSREMSQIIRYQSMRAMEIHLQADDERAAANVDKELLEIKSEFQQSKNKVGLHLFEE